MAFDQSKQEGSLSTENPFYEGYNAGLDLSGCVSVSFDTTSTETVNVLSTILSFRDDAKDTGRLYFTPGSYLGYNVGTYGGYYDANFNNYSLVEDYIGESAHGTLNFVSDGFIVEVDGEEVYNQEILETDNGSYTLTDHRLVLNWLKECSDTVLFWLWKLVVRYSE
jgi:hypothetical protein